MNFLRRPPLFHLQSTERNATLSSYKLSSLPFLRHLYLLSESCAI